MLRVIIITVVIILLAGAYLYALPACPEVFIAKQPDGTEFQARAKGDEYANWIETKEGYPVIINKQTGFWEYAQVKPLVGLSPAGKVVGRHAPDGIKKISASEILQSRLFMMSERSGLLGGFTTSGSSAEPSPAPEAPQPAPLNILGTRKLAVILVSFANRPLVTTESNWESRLFGATNSVKEYFNEVSYGQLLIAPAEETGGIVNDGVISVTLTTNHPNTGGVFGAANQQLAKDAIIAADPYVDFALFDSDTNGIITSNELHIVVIAAGFEYSYIVHGVPALWAHKWAIDGNTSPPVSAPIVDGKTVGGLPGGYIQLGELHNDHQATVGVLIHELSHDLGNATVSYGLVDLYDTDGTSNGAGNWDTMSYGAWNKTNYNGDTPAHFSAWCKWYLGWIVPTQVSAPTGAVAFPRVETAIGADRGVKQLFTNPDGPEIGGTGEYFLLENRQKTGYDSALPGEGLLIWHIDETQVDNDNAARKLVDLEEADGLNNLDNKINKGDAGDPYPGSSVKRILDNASNPNSKFYSGLQSALAVANISDSGAEMSADIISTSDLPPVLSAPGDWGIDVVQPLSFTLSASDPEGDPIAYSIVSTPAGATLDAVTGVFNWVPGYSQEGVYDITFTATANVLSDSKTVRITVSQVVPPAPAGLSAHIVSSISSNLAWTDNASNETGFKIERSYDNITFTQIATVGVDASSYLDNEVSSQGACYYRIRAYNAVGDSAYSNTALLQATPVSYISKSDNKNNSKCGCLGPEALILFLLVRLIRKRKSKV
ncbi:MAG: M6 family metalloprotease domain-containing protein [Planctomycetes bacterium]|nr:M6 family metalloprotease domain-containing protein [Planctomycetota bacterium]